MWLAVCGCRLLPHGVGGGPIGVGRGQGEQPSLEVTWQQAISGLVMLHGLQPSKRDLTWLTAERCALVHDRVKSEVCR